MNLNGVMCAVLMVSAVPASARGAAAVKSALDALSPGAVVSGFRATALYVDGNDRPIGARLVHARSGFELHYLVIQSVPQGWIWVNSFPPSDMGEPHTQEHLLLLKGNKGRGLLDHQEISLATNTAFTQQWRTCYLFNTVAGADAFYKTFEREMDALLHPDYNDEEIRREVRNFGVTQNPATKKLGLEEKGSVYNEMVSAFAQPQTRVAHQLSLALYGKGHPLANVSGGLPSAMGQLKPEDIRKFHHHTYHLRNMGMIAAFPKEVPLPQALAAMDQALQRLEPQPPNLTFKTEADLPAPEMAPAGSVELVPYPDKNDQQPGLVYFAWPASQRLDSMEQELLQLFLRNVAGDATTNLYRRFIDSRTREMEMGATAVFASFRDDLGYPVYLGFRDVAPAYLTQARIEEVRGKVMQEMAKIAGWKDGAAELLEFNGRVKNLLTQWRRENQRLIASPPRFGFRSAGSAWMSHLRRLDRSSDFRKSVTLKPELTAIEKLLAGKRNFWAGYIAKWKLAETKPYAVAAVASSELVKKEEQQRQARIQAEVARLEAKYGVKDDQAAIARYRADYDQATAALKQLARSGLKMDGFSDKPPLTLDDSLLYKVATLPGGIPLVTSTFDNMTRAALGVALRLDGVPESEWVYLAALPALMSRVGVIQNGRPISYEQMTQLLRKEIASLDANFDTNFGTGRAELVVEGTGNDGAEARRAAQWMKAVLTAPNWRSDNLPRIRDLLDQLAGNLRTTTQRPEESWVSNPAFAYWRQDHPLLLATSSFLTRAHHLHRLRWLFKDSGSAGDRAAFGGYLQALAGAAAHAGRADLKLLLEAVKARSGAADSLPPAVQAVYRGYQGLGGRAKELARDAATDLQSIIADIPDDALAGDWAYLCGQIRHDVSVTPEKALAVLDGLRRRLMESGRARVWLVGSRPLQAKLGADVRGLATSFRKAPAAPAKPSAGERLVDARLKDRVRSGEPPVFVGLLVPNMKGGVVINSTPIADFHAVDRETLLKFLAARLYGGRGTNSVYTKTLDAGLAYGNGMRYSISLGRLSWYAERVPELPQTLQHVIESVKRGSRDPSLAEYAVAQAFAEIRSAQDYETRAAAMAADLADGLTPEVVSHFHRAILGLRASANLADELFARMDEVYGRVLPGYRGRASHHPDTSYFVLGPEKQLRSYEEYLQSAEGPEARVHRLYPRDYWQTLKEAAAHATR